jgi:hypothetical protein
MEMASKAIEYLTVVCVARTFVYACWLLAVSAISVKMWGWMADTFFSPWSETVTRFSITRSLTRTQLSRRRSDCTAIAAGTDGTTTTDTTIASIISATVAVAICTYVLTYLLLTPWSRVLEKLTGSQPVKEFLAFYWTRRFITAFTSAHHLFLT